MTITSLMDDYCPSRGLVAQHGLSIHIESGGHGILFDAGQDDLPLRNAEALGIDLRRLDAVVLSHGHYDHAGGLAAFYEYLEPATPTLFVGEGYGAMRLSRSSGAEKDIGAALPRPAGHDIAPSVIRAPAGILPGLFVLPGAPVIDGSEPVPRFRTRSGGVEDVDRFDDELSLAIVGSGTVSVITGCAHRGIVNIVDQALRLFPGRRLGTLVGGFHMVDAPEDALERIAGRIADYGPISVRCGHCTGPGGFAALVRAMPGRVAWFACGARLTLGDGPDTTGARER